MIPLLVVEKNLERLYKRVRRMDCWWELFTLGVVDREKELNVHVENGLGRCVAFIECLCGVCEGGSYVL